MVFVRCRHTGGTATVGRHWVERGSIFRLGDLEPHEGALQWQCPWCGYSLLFEPHDDVVAESAVRTHLLSQHGARMWGDVVLALKSLQDGLR